MHSAFVKMMTTRFGKDVIDPATGIRTVLGSCRDTVANSLCLEAFNPQLYDRSDITTEIAYTYRYVINNGRTEGPRWSVRQTTVYQKMNMETGCSTWIFIQPNDIALNQFKAMCLLSSEDSEQPMAPHLAFLNAARMDWKSYIGHLRSLLQGLVRYRFIAIPRRMQYSYRKRFRTKRRASRESEKITKETMKSPSLMDSSSRRFVANYFDQRLCSVGSYQ